MMLTNQERLIANLDNFSDNFVLNYIKVNQEKEDEAKELSTKFSDKFKTTVTGLIDRSKGKFSTSETEKVANK